MPYYLYIHNIYLYQYYDTRPNSINIDWLLGRTPTVIQSRNSFKYKSSHPKDQIIGNKETPRRTRSHFRPEESALGLLSMIEPTKVDEALTYDGWILAMQDELNQFKRNDVWDLVPKPERKNIIGTKWVFRNKLNEQAEDGIRDVRW